MRPENNLKADLSKITREPQLTHGKDNSGQQLSDADFIRELVVGIIFSIAVVAVIATIFIVRYLVDKQ